MKAIKYLLLFFTTIAIISCDLFVEEEVVTYSVEYNGNGNTSGTVPNDSNNYKSGSSIILKSNSGNLSKDGFTFTCWNTNENGSGTDYYPGDDFEISNDNVIVYAKWTVIPTYSIFYDGNGNTGGDVPTDNNEYTENSIITVKNKTESLVKTDNEFIGWNTLSDGTGTSYFGGDDITVEDSDITLYAEWESTIENEYTITFDSKGGSEVNSIQVMENNYAVKPNNPTKEGYVFVNWYQDATHTTLWDFDNNMVTSNITLYAKWRALNTFTVKFYSNGGSIVSQIAILEGNTLSQPIEPIKEGYKFIAWYSDSNLNNLWDFYNDSVLSDISLYAKWELLEEYIITFNSNGGSEVNSIQVMENNYAVKPNNPTKEGYTFENWYKDDLLTILFDLDVEKITSNITLFAKWELPVIKVFTYNSRTYFLKSDGSLYRAKSNALPELVLSNIKKVSTTDSHSLILKENGDLYSEGSNFFGQLGDGTETNRSIPVLVTSNVKDIAISENRSYILKNDNSLYFCGLYSSDNWLSMSTPFHIDDDVLLVSSGRGTNLTLKNNGKLYNKNTLLMSDVNKVFTNNFHSSFIIKNDGTLYGFGKNNYGQLGDGTKVDRSTPVIIMNDVKEVDSALWHTIILKKDGSAYATGQNTSGQCGDGTTINITTPKIIMNDIKKIKVSYRHSLFLKNDGVLYSTGSNEYGAAGNGSEELTLSPVVLMDNVEDIFTGISSSFILKKDGSLYAFGRNDSGQLGDGTKIDRFTPVRINFR